MGRVVLAGAVAMSLAGMYASAAIAGTWNGAAADPRIAFPVFQPSNELGLHASVLQQPCGPDARSAYVIANYRRALSPARVAIYESSPQLCGNAGERSTVTRVRIGGRSVRVNVFCRAVPTCHATVRDGYRQGFELQFSKPAAGAGKRTLIEIETSHVRLDALVRLARSLKELSLPKGPWPSIHAESVLSPDERIWCTILDSTSPPRAWCVTKVIPQHSAELHADGTLVGCRDAGGVCTQNWAGSGDPVLAVGQSTDIHGFRCTGTASGMTCTVVSGSAMGNGFTIDAAGVTKITPANAQASSARTIYFPASPFGLLSNTNPLVVRPKGFAIFLDGQWVLRSLRWTHWGADVAHATGISSTSDDNPNAASGKRIETSAKVTLSNPGPFRGHTVYRCVNVIVPPPAHFGPRRCLKGKGQYAYYG